MAKRYFWLKLKEDYFNSPRIKKLRKIAGGDTFVIIYLKMQLMSVSNGAVIEYEGIEPTFAEELALKLDEDVDNVSVVLAFLQGSGLIETSDNSLLFLETNSNIGSESEGAERKRRFDERKKEKALQSNGEVTSEKRSSISNSISLSNILNFINGISNVLYKRHVDNPNADYNLAVLLNSITYSEEEIKTMLAHASKTYIVQPKYKNLDIIWCVNNYKKVMNTEIIDDGIPGNDKQENTTQDMLGTVVL